MKSIISKSIIYFIIIVFVCILAAKSYEMFKNNSGARQVCNTGICSSGGHCTAKVDCNR